MHNVAEEITGEWLRYIKGCNFVEYNVKGPHQTEIDVIGLKMAENTIYVCEVAAHIQGLQYVNTKTSQPNTANKFIQKFKKDKDYIDKHFPHFKKIYMLWSPVVKVSRTGAKYNALQAVKDVQLQLQRELHIQLELVVNEHYLAAINQLKEYASNISYDLSKSAVLRYLQIEGCLQKYASKLKEENKL